MILSVFFLEVLLCTVGSTVSMIAVLFLSGSAHSGVEPPTVAVCHRPEVDRVGDSAAFIESAAVESWEIHGQVPLSPV